MRKQTHASKDEIMSARSVVRQIVAHHPRGSNFHVRYLPGGRTNFVFDVRHGRSSYIVRINSNASKLQSFIKEQWAVSKVKKLGVPTPEILEVGNDISEWPYMISRRVEGSEATSHPCRSDIVAAMGRYAAIINSVRTKGFGATFDWSKNRLSRNLTWEEFLDEELKLSHRLKLLRSNGLISERQRQRIRSILRNNSLPANAARLNHGDLRLKNVLVDRKGRITAIVDWEHCVSNTVEWELSVALHDLSIDEKQQFLSSYGISNATLTRTAPLIKALNILNYAATLENLTSHQRAKRLKKYETRMKGILDLFCI
jgi:aminoglycoside phosphotransferase (APT) family kinase protein